MPGKLRDHEDWTIIRDKEYYKELLKEKRKIIHDFYLPFPKKIEEMFWEAISKGNGNPEIYLENLCHAYIKRALDNTPKIMHEVLLSSTESNILTQKEIVDILGNYGYTELRKSGLIKRVGSSMVFVYQIRE